jgi:hypothetical protein
MKVVKKKPHQCSIRTTITLTPVLYDASRDMLRKGGYSGLSDYVQARLRRDCGLDKEVVAT